MATRKSRTTCTLESFVVYHDKSVPVQILTAHMGKVKIVTTLSAFQTKLLTTYAKLLLRHSEVEVGKCWTRLLGFGKTYLGTGAGPTF